MDKKILFVFGLILCLLSPFADAQSNNQYAYSIDLTNVVEDRIKVTLKTPKMNGSKVTFQMPSIVPGTYSKLDYGRFVTDFAAFDLNNAQLPVLRKGDNQFEISQANKLDRVEYWVNDSWDDSNTKQFVFQPAGTNIEDGKNFAINHHAFFGYFHNYKNLPIELRFKKNADLYGATPLKRKTISATEDVFTAPNYVFLVDNPLMYSKPDTVSYMVANTRVHVAIYSPSGTIKATQIMDYLQPITQALGTFFGTMPVSHYHFLMYFAGPDTELPEVEEGLSGWGALEHSYSSFYFLPEIAYEDAIKNLVRDVCAHEFLHILTPLNIHSHEIEDFNFEKPDMSMHLWMYEGITEYFAHLSQVQAGVISQDDFKRVIREKIIGASKFAPLSFTKMSKKIVEPEYEKHYLNVYQKGALIGMGLDLELIRLSKGKYGLRNLMLDLTKKYGANKPFDDKQLIKEIIKMTYPEIGKFFKQYVVGKNEIDYEQYLRTVGWQYAKSESVNRYSFGEFGIGFDPETKRLFFAEVKENRFNIQENDFLFRINGQELTMENVQLLLGDELMNKQNDTPVTLTVERNGNTLDLVATPEMTAKNAPHVLRDTEKPNEQQLKYRQFWLEGK